MERLPMYLRLSERIPGWTRGDEAAALAWRAFNAPADSIVVEIGSFLGSGSVLLAGARKLRGSGKVHCVDPFNGSGEDFSLPHYETIIRGYLPRTPREVFDDNIKRCGLGRWVEAHQGTALAVALNWSRPIDLLFMDGDQSPAGARAAYRAWSPWLKSGGLIALHNSNPREDGQGHDGHLLVVQEFVRPPVYEDIELIASTTFARKCG